MRKGNRGKAKPAKLAKQKSGSLTNGRTTYCAEFTQPDDPAKATFAKAAVLAVADAMDSRDLDGIEEWKLIFEAVTGQSIFDVCFTASGNTVRVPLLPFALRYESLEMMKLLYCMADEVLHDSRALCMRSVANLFEDLHPEAECRPYIESLMIEFLACESVKEARAFIADGSPFAMPRGREFIMNHALAMVAAHEAAELEDMVPNPSPIVAPRAAVRI